MLNNIRVESPRLNAILNPGTHYWRSRARDSQGRTISQFSGPHKIEVPRLATPPALAKVEPKVDRKPAATQTSVYKFDEKPAEPLGAEWLVCLGGSWLQLR